jgi:hypothetical protein
MKQGKPRWGYMEVAEAWKPGAQCFAIILSPARYLLRVFAWELWKPGDVVLIDSRPLGCSGSAGELEAGDVVLAHGVRVGVGRIRARALAGVVLLRSGEPAG